MSIFEACKLFCVAFALKQLAFECFPFIYQQLIAPAIFGSTLDFRQLGKWAVITGSTDGIGLEYAKHLAKEGLNLILISRSLAKLQRVAREIEEEFNVATLVIDVDFSHGYEIYEKIRGKIEGKEIGVLVNNVGICYDVPDYFLSLPDREDFIKNVIQINVASVPMMCSLILPSMVERKRGLIINVASILTLQPAGLYTIYSASKSFVSKFSEDLAFEYEKDGIIVQTLNPGAVKTKMTDWMVDNIFTPNVKDYVNSALKTIGNSRSTVGHLAHIVAISYYNTLIFISPALFRKYWLLSLQMLKKKSN